MDNVKTIVIDRSKWRTGGTGDNATGKGATLLNNQYGFKCCLGFICRAYKKSTKRISMPEQTGCKIPHLTQRRGLLGSICNTDLTLDAAQINDDTEMTLEDKEQKLVELFKGKFNLEFVGTPVKYPS